MGLTPIADFLKEITAGAPRTIQGLTFVPLVAQSRQSPQFCIYVEGLAKKVKIREATEHGVVSRIVVDNRLDQPVLLLSTQELLGAKQNRAVVGDILVAAGTKSEIPCACVEQGSWAYRTKCFRPAGYMPRGSRAKSAARLTANLCAEQGRAFDQGETWNDVSMLLSRSRTRSRTQAMNAVYRLMAPRLAPIREQVELPESSVGVAVLGRGRLLGVDLFDRASSFAHVQQGLLDSYSLDWLVTSDEPAVDGPAAVGEEEVLRVLHGLADSQWKTFQPPGLGQDLRVESEQWTAAALCHEGSVLHAQVFPRVKVDSAEPRPVPATRAAPSSRPAHATPQREGAPIVSECPRCKFTYGRIVVDEGYYCNHCGQLEEIQGPG